MNMDMMKAISIVVILIFVCLAIFSIINAIKTSKRNKAADEVSAKIFMADVEKDMKNKTDKFIKPDQIQNLTYLNPTKIRKPLDYDTYEEDEIPEEAQGKSLKDFFSN